MRIEQHFHNQYKEDQDCELAINANLDFTVYNISAVVAGQKVEFGVDSLPDDDISQAELQQLCYDTYVLPPNWHESSDAIHLGLGQIPKSSDVIIVYECSIVASLMDSKTISYILPTEINFPIEIDLQIETFSPIETITGPAVKITKSDELHSKVTSTFTCSDPETRLNIKTVEDIESTAVARDIGDETFIGVSVSPKIAQNTSAKSEVFLVIDCSGSMSGSPIRAARDTLMIFLKSLPADSYFNVIRFGTNFEQMFPDDSVEYNNENYTKAMQLVPTMEADLGGTDFLSPLTHIVQTPIKDGYVRQVFVLTDGEVEHRSECLSMATSHRQDHRIFSVGIGNSVDKVFIEEVARCSTGTSEFVNGTSKDILRAVMNQLTSALTPAVVGVQAHVEGAENFEIAPFPIPTLFVGTFAHLYLKCTHLDGDVAVMITGENFEDSMECHRLDHLNLDKSFAFFNIHDMEEKLTLARDDEVETIKAQVIQESNKRGIPSQFTALHNRAEGPWAKRKTAGPQQQQQLHAVQNPGANKSSWGNQCQKMNRRQVEHQQAFSKRRTGEQVFTKQTNDWGTANCTPQVQQNWTAMNQCGMDEQQAIISRRKCAKKSAAPPPQPQAPAPALAMNQMQGFVPPQQMQGMMNVAPQQMMNVAPQQQQQMQGMMNVRPSLNVNRRRDQQPQREQSTGLQDTLMYIMMNQNYHGFWELPPGDVPKYFTVTGADLGQFDKDTQIALTMVTYLQKKQKENENIWKLAVDKTMKWLETKDSGFDWSGILANLDVALKE